VASCKKGDVDAFEVLVRKHQKKVFNLAFRMIGSYEDASEVVQDAFVSAYRCIKDFQENAKFSTWLSTIVVNLSRNRLKQLKGRCSHEEFSLDASVLTDEGRISIEPASGEPSVLEKLQRRDVQQKVQECIRLLENEFREVIVLRDIQGFSYDEISAMLHLPGGTVKSRLFRARLVLREYLKNVTGVL
jgi:RNA polymerase sigma-70 factor (ECF subfamily)